MITIAAKVGAALAALFLLESLKRTRGTIELAFDYQTCECSKVEYHPDGRITRIPMPVSACIDDGLDIKGCEDRVSTFDPMDPGTWFPFAAWSERSVTAGGDALNTARREVA